MKCGDYADSRNTYLMVCKIYNRWKVNNVHIDFAEQGDLVSHAIPLEFGVDDYISVKAALAEALFNVGDVDEALAKFENVRRTIESEIVYENPLLVINVCN